MADCHGCRKPLNASWNVVVTDSPFYEMGPYFNLNDNYSLCTVPPYWVFCYCNACWQKYTLAFTSSFHAKEVNTLKETNNFLQRQLASLRYENTLLQKQLMASEQNCTVLQEQLSVSCNKLASYKNQLDGLDNKYDKISNALEIEKLRDLFKKLAALYNYTKSHVDTVETAYNQQHSKDSICQILTTAGVSKETIDTSVREIQEWNTFSDSLLDNVEQQQQQQTILLLYLKQSR